MKLAGAKKQTVFLTGINAVVRALGLLMRMLLSRVMGAEIMGISELAQSVHMVIIAPLTSGLPQAISRLTARETAQSRKTYALEAGLFITRISSLILIPAMWLFSKQIAFFTGDVRILPSLWFSAPCVLVLGYSAAYNGYCYGVQRSHLPAISELIEQIVRVLFTFVLLAALKHLTPAWMAALPTAATLFAEILGLAFVIGRIHTPHCFPARGHSIQPVLRLALPSTFSRLIQTILRSATAILIPIRLQHSGLSGAEATAQLGMFNGMVMPMLMFPCIFTSALSMVALPKLAKAEDEPSEFRRLIFLCTSSCIPVAALSGAAIYVAAPFLAIHVYRQPELTTLFRLCTPMTILFAANHLSGSILSAIGEQKHSMIASVLVSLVTLGMTWMLAAEPTLRIRGVATAQAVGQMMMVVANIFIMFAWKSQKAHYQTR